MINLVRFDSKSFERNQREEYFLKKDKREIYNFFIIKYRKVKTKQQQKLLKIYIFPNFFFSKNILVFKKILFSYITFK